MSWRIDALNTDAPAKAEDKRIDLPQPLPEPPPVPEPQDKPYCGTIRLEVDASDVYRRIWRVTEHIPVPGPGPMMLIYPKWLPGFHAPQAPIELFAGLEIFAGGEQLTWIRHPVTVNAFTIDVPDGVGEVEARFQFLSPTDPSQGRVIVTPDLLMLQWNTVLLYPARHFARQIQMEASITVPPGWEMACALEAARREGDTILFHPASLDVVVDSPVLAGRHSRVVELDEQVRLNIAGDRADLLAASDEQIAPHRALVRESDALFGARHFDHFEILLALSEDLTGAGIEHHRSCEAVSISNYFTDWETTFARRDTLPHEYVHSWNGKHRKGSDSWQPCFEKPIRNSLMWVYEGQTEYWSRVLCARSGLWTAAQARESLAVTAATFSLRPGSRWRPLIDTTRDPIIAARAPLPWKSWQRSEDYYPEGALIWLDVDTLLRELSGEARSLDDFARSFFGADDKGPVTNTYRFEDVIGALDAIAPYDWVELFERHLTQRHDDAPIGGLERGGYRLVYRAEPSAFTTSSQAVFGTIDHNFSIGLSLSKDGEVKDVLWEGPAYHAGITTGSKILAIGSRAFDLEVLDEGIAATAKGAPLQLTIKSASHVREVVLDYAGGIRHPHLERIEGARPRLDDILTPIS
jgi:predicted metalloprotease with PDZ domain